MRCPHCGRVDAPGAIRCGNCGGSLVLNTYSSPFAEPAPGTWSANQRAALIVALPITCLVVLIILVLFQKQPMPTPVTAASPAPSVPAVNLPHREAPQTETPPGILSTSAPAPTVAARPAARAAAPTQRIAAKPTPKPTPNADDLYWKRIEAEDARRTAREQQDYQDAMQWQNQMYLVESAGTTGYYTRRPELLNGNAPR
jgi:hypothetical protein